MKLNPYLTFDGQCESAINFYADVLDGEIKMLSRFSDMPEGEFEVPESAKNLVMHCTLEFRGNSILASDTIEEHSTGTDFSLSLNAEDNEEGEALFNSLAENGKVIMPFAEVFWGGKFGMLTDQFGVRWMISGPHKP